MSDYRRPLRHQFQRCIDEVSEHHELTEVAETELVSLAQFLVLYLDEQVKASDKPLQYLKGLITLYGVTGARDQFRRALKECLKIAGSDGDKIYALANQICYASRSGKLGTDDDYSFFVALFTEKYGADYFRTIVDRLAASKVEFRISNGEIDQ